MNKYLNKMFSVFTILALMLMALPMQSVQAAPPIIASPTDPVFINEIHYDNTGTDAGEAIEIFGPAGTDLTGWSIVRYNGSNGQAYTSPAANPAGSDVLSGTIPNLCSGFGVVVVNYLQDGLQNGAPDAIALVNASNTVVQFLSYEGSFTATNGVANGLTSTDIGVDEDPTPAAGNSLRLTGSGTLYGDFTWNAPATASFGAVNTGQTCGGGDVAPTVSSTTPTNGATNVAVNTNITVNFSEAVDVAAGVITVECPSGTPVASNAVADNVTSVVIDPASDLPFSTLCAINVTASGVTDEDVNDPPNDMSANFNATFTTTGPTPPPGAVVISEVYGGGGNATAPFKNDYIELYNRTASSISLAGWSVQYASAAGTSWAVTNLTGSIAPGRYYLVAEAAGNSCSGLPCGVDLPTPDATGTIAMSGTAGKVALVQNSTALTGSCPTGSHISDFVGYGTTANCFEGSGPTPAPSNTTSVIRLGDGATDTDNNAADFVAGAPDPDNSTDVAPTVSSTTPANGAANVLVGSNIDVTFSEAVNASSGSFTISCSTSGAHTAALSGGPITYNLNPDTDFVTTETCTVTVVAAQVTDQDTDDPPDNMTSDVVFNFSTEGPVCEQIFTPIYSIQGSGPSAAITGNVTTQGVVVGDFEGTASASGFYIQDLTGDGNAATSDGIFVFTGAANLASAGDLVRVTGFARERFPNPMSGFGQTSLNGSDSNTSPVTNVVNCGTGSVPVTDVTLPFADANFPERYEGMYVRFPQNLVIAEYFNYDQFGEIVLALPLDGEPRPFSGTALDEPGDDANARTLANSLRRITLDDAQSATNPPVLRHPNGDPFSLSPLNLFRGGDLVQNAIGVLGFDFNLYRIVPTGPANYTADNPRPVAPEAVGGSLRVAAMNTLNFFITQDYPTGNPLDNKCGPAQNVECRGADFIESQEFTRQRNKLLQALAGLNGDVIGLNEIENTTGVDPLGDPTNGIVAGLNSIFGPGTYSYINTGVIGTDAIRVGLIYKPAVVSPVGAFQVLTTAVDPRFIDTRSRPVLAQTFEVIATGARFTVAVNHLKSKGSACADIGDPDLLDGQGNCSQTRRAAAEALVDWLNDDPTGSGDPDFLIMGDLNSYAKEDAIDEIQAGSDDTVGTGDDFINLIDLYHGPFAYSYTFDGQAGYLDHALANVSLAAQVTGAADWHINSDEPDVVDYDTSFKPTQQEALYEPNAYRSSDHDPVIVGLDLDAPPDTTITSNPPTLTNSTSASFSFSGTDDVTPSGSLTFECDLDGGGFSLCSSPQTYNSLADGSHTFQVRATDEAGNIDPTPASFTWTIDTVAPTISVAAGGMCSASGGTMNLTVADSSGNPLTLSGSSSNTTAVPNANIVFGGSGSSRTVAITAVAGSTVRTATLTINVSDGVNTASTTITVIVGTSGNNTALNGTSGANLILGLDGNDTLSGLAGNDLLCGGIKNDTLNGGANDDTLRGEAGNDSLTGSTGADLFSGGAGNDTNTDFNAGQGDTNDGT
jgi:uncharacterized protein